MRSVGVRWPKELFLQLLWSWLRDAERQVSVVQRVKKETWSRGRTVRAELASHIEKRRCTFEGYFSRAWMRRTLQSADTLRMASLHSPGKTTSRLWRGPAGMWMSSASVPAASALIQKPSQSEATRPHESRQTGCRVLPIRLRPLLPTNKE